MRRHAVAVGRGLAAQLDMDSYRVDVFDRYSIQSGAGAGDVGEKGSDFSERIGDRATNLCERVIFMSTGHLGELKA